MIASLYSICRQTVSIWLKNWDKNGVCGLVDKSGRGQRKILSPAEEIEAIKIINSSPRSLKKALAEIENIWGIKLSIKTLKRLCKRSGLSWKRVRKSLRGKRDDEQFYKALEGIKLLMDQEDKGEVDFYYFDDAGFTLELSIPYAWQGVGQCIEVLSSKRKRFNVLGFIDRKCHFESHVFEGM